MKTNRFSNQQSVEKNGIISDSIDMELLIDIDDLNGEIMNQPLMMRKYTKLKADVHAKAKIIELKLKETEALYYIEHSKKGHKVKDVESLVALEPEVKQLKFELIEAEKLLEVYEGIVRATAQRHDSLKDLAANIRKELI